MCFLSFNSHSTKNVRPDIDLIARWIVSGSSVLDLGCGDGGLLRYLGDMRGVRGYGVEIDEANVVTCIENSVNVIQADLNCGLADFADSSFDFVVLSRTLQATFHTNSLVREMLRVGRQAIVSFPNLGYWRNRVSLLWGSSRFLSGTHYRWHDNPNVHWCTLVDFEVFCRDQNIAIVDRIVMAGDRSVEFFPSLLGSLALYLVRRGGS